MKNFIYLFMVLGLVFTSCDPMEDIHDDIDRETALDDIVGEVTYTFTDEDYTKKKDEGGYFELSFPNFGSIDEAKTLTPLYLTGTYPVWGVTWKDGEIKEASTATITFKWYSPMSTPSANVYALTDDDHNDITGNTFGNFDRSYYIFNYLEATYPNPVEGDFHSLRYRFWGGGETTLTDGFIFENEEWTQIKGFTPDEYSNMGERFPNFSSHDEAAIKIPLALPDIFKFQPKKAGDIVQAMYELWKGGGVTESYVNNYIFDGNTWAKYNNVAEETIKFGHDGTVWVPDNTIKYTLTSADYDLVENGRFGNFDVRSGRAEETVEVRLAKINTILLNNFPSDAEGQKYNVSYNVWSGANEVWNMKVIKTGAEYVLQ
ncbi:MAG: hypothetical protein L3J08_00070 [Flavobacteriaceae bacterium]|nr:hypothetical protein [Flavobacteriaceae bacterium]